MNQSMVLQIEDTFRRLPISDRLLLLECLVHQVHLDTLRQTSDLDSQLALMAADPEIRNELERIEQEFAHTAADGLENV
ncbi:MAG: hypothetical protein ACREDR_43855 [Blastocatellia bacterium]